MIKSLVDLFLIKWEMRPLGSGLGREHREPNRQGPQHLRAALSLRGFPGQPRAESVPGEVPEPVPGAAGGAQPPVL